MKTQFDAHLYFATNWGPRYLFLFGLLYISMHFMRHNDAKQQNPRIRVFPQLPFVIKRSTMLLSRASDQPWAGLSACILFENIIWWYDENCQASFIFILPFRRLKM